MKGARVKMRLKTSSINQMKHLLVVTGFSIFLLETLSGLAIVYAQSDGGGVPPDALEEWFYARLPWSFVLGVIAGLVVGWVLARKIRYGVSDIEVDLKARNRFYTFVIIFAVFLGVCTLVDVATYFTDSFPAIFRQAWMSWQNFVILFVALAACSITASLTTRFIRGSRCRYALWLSPKVK